MKKLKRYELTSWRVENPKMVSQNCQIRNPSIEHVLRWWRCNAPVKLEWCASWVVGNDASFWLGGGVFWVELVRVPTWCFYSGSYLKWFIPTWCFILEATWRAPWHQWPPIAPRCWTTRSWDQRPHGSPRSVLDSWPGAWPKPWDGARASKTSRKVINEFRKWDMNCGWTIRELQFLDLLATMSTAMPPFVNWDFQDHGNPVIHWRMMCAGECRCWCEWQHPTWMFDPNVY